MRLLLQFLCRAQLIGCVLFVGYGVSLNSAVAEDFGCKDLEKFTLDGSGGQFTYRHARVVAVKGALEAPTEFTARICPGSFTAESLKKDLPYFKKNPDGSKGERVRGIDVLTPSTVYATIELKAPNGLHLKKGANLNYCLLGSEKAPASDVMIFHEKNLAPPAPGLKPTAQEQCVTFHSLSFWHKLTHGVSSAANAAAHGITKGADAAAHGVESAADDVAKAGTKIGDDVAKGAETGLKALEGLLHPCDACKAALGAGIRYFQCKSTATQMLGETEDCAAEVAATQPELVEFSEAICAALEAGVKEACQQDINNSVLKTLEDKIISEACHAAHLCG